MGTELNYVALAYYIERRLRSVPWFRVFRVIQLPRPPAAPRAGELLGPPVRAGAPRICGEYNRRGVPTSVRGNAELSYMSPSRPTL